MSSEEGQGTLSPGTYCVFCPKSGGIGATLFGSLSFGRSNGSGKWMQQRIERLLRNARKDSKGENEEKRNVADTSGQLGVGAWNSSPNVWHLCQGTAAVVNFGLFEVVGGIHRVQPSVYHDAEKNDFCVFQGYLNNLDELMDRYVEQENISRESSPTAVVSPEKSPGERAAQIVCTMFTQGDDPLVQLSELQGQYAFVIYDGERRQIFTARDSSGRDDLFFEIDEDGGITISNKRVKVSSSDGMGFVQWDELPPGHYLAGRSIKMHQFALTPAQLSEREYFDTLEDDSSHHSSRRSPSMENLTLE